MEDKKIESNIYDLEDNLNLLELQKFLIIIIKIFNINYYKNLLYFYNLFKIRVINQTIYENKYIITYKRLYALRNLIINFSYKTFNNNDFINIAFNYWYNSKILYLKKSNNTKSQYINIIKTNYLRIIVLNIIIKNTKRRFNAVMTKKYFLLLIKYYLYIFDKYYIRAIMFAKNIYNYVRRILKPYKSKLYSRINFEVTEEDIINIFRYILINYIKINDNNKYKKEQVNSLIKGYNKTIKHNYDELITNLLKTSRIYIIFYKYIINKFLINRNIALIFFKWKQNSLDQILFYNLQNKEKYINNLIYSKLNMFSLVIKKNIKNNFETFYNNLFNNQTNGIILPDSYELLSILNFESLYQNYLYSILKGLYKLQNFRNIHYSRIFKMNKGNSKIIVLNKWKKNNNIMCNHYQKNTNKIYNTQIEIIKGINLIDKRFFLFYNKKYLKLINSLLNRYYYNQNNQIIYLKLDIFFGIFEKKVIFKRKKNIFKSFLILSSLSQDDKILKNELSFFIRSIENYIKIKNDKYKSFFCKKLKENNISIDYSRDLKSIYNKNINISKNVLLENTKLIALKKILKYIIYNSIKNHFIYSLSNSFNLWASLIGYIPKSVRETEKDIIYQYESENEDEDDDIINQRNELKELQKCLKEDEDFQHDLKAKITALDEENTFICEKIFEITQRVEKCEKCSILLKTSNKSDNNMRVSYESMNKIIHENKINSNNINEYNKKSRNNFPVEGTITSGLNFVSVGTELIPRKPMASSNLNEEPSEPMSKQMDDVDENQVESNNFSETYLNEIKLKIKELKNEKEPIVNKLKDEIKTLYLELNMI